MQRLAPALALAALLAACGPQQKAENAAPAAAASAVAGPAAEVNLDEGSVVVAGGRPAFAPEYPGGAVVTTITANENGKVGGVYGFTTTDSADKVFAFYRVKAEAAGLASQTNIETGGARIYGAQGTAGDVAITAAPQGPGQTYVQVTWSTPKG